MSHTILIKKEYTKADVTKASEAAGKTKGRTAGSWVHDLCALRKVITLCSACTHKFNPGRLGYIREKEWPVVQAKCDGCTVFDSRCTAYFWEETYKTVRSTASDRRAERTAVRKRQLKEGY
jgi:hypothetical protein